ncbi:unnamed protein product [Rangifer tarandus platyrhynchus]|uniref:Uncharacterized protein n=1 Tax=Rangifer tarandus platyrhynchus TaxID=3082113 RepID=A0ABN8ZUL1_RANTA|nr:unnamed protein product [Rangifer tarandus platyrhynchus]
MCSDHSRRTVLAISNNDICSLFAKGPAVSVRRCQKQAETVTEGLNPHHALGKPTGAGGSAKNTFQHDPRPWFPPSGFGRAHQEQSPQGLRKDKYGIPAPWGERAAQPGPHTLTSGRPLALLSRLSLRACRVTMLFIASRAPAPYLALHARLMDPSCQRPHGAAAPQASSPRPARLPPPSNHPSGSEQASPLAAADPFEEAVSERGESR